ncbi:MAG: NAD-binding protein [Acidimicrobiia bacterium]
MTATERNIPLRRALLRAILAVAVIVITLTVMLWLREGDNPAVSFMSVMLMLSGSMSLLDIGTRHTETQVVVTAVSYARLVILAVVMATTMDFILRHRLPMLYTRRSKRMNNHVILCGLGQVGYRVLLELQRFDTEVTVVEPRSDGPFIALATDMGIPILFDDARNPDVLVKAGLDRARAVVACTDDDLTNVEIAIDAREIRPDIRVVLRMFDQRLAGKIVASFDIELAFSASALAAPAFAAAAVDPSVRDTFYVAEMLYVHSSFFVPEGSTLCSQTVWDLWGKYDVNTIGFTDMGENISRNPGPGTSIPDRTTIAVVGPYEQIQRLQVEHGIIDSAALVHHDDTAMSNPVRYMTPSAYLDPGR